jgi:3-methyladenine DNA glycosylase AlkD
MVAESIVKNGSLILKNKKMVSKNTRLQEIKSLLAKSCTIAQDRQSYFFKTGAGSYAEHDQFIGVPVPARRAIAKKYPDLSLCELEQLLKSPINEERFLALILLTNQYQKADYIGKEQIYQFYMNNLKQVNNWNLVDASAHLIIGNHLFDKNRTILIQLAQSNNMWKRRIAIVATWYFIRKNDLTSTFQIAQLLLNDTHDLIHKATGWMLREAGKKDQQKLIDFLDLYSPHMPRTMLRYAIEKFPEEQRKSYLKTGRKAQDQSN